MSGRIMCGGSGMGCLVSAMMCGCFSILLAQAPLPPQPSDYPPLVGIQQEDLAVARSSHPTKLLRSGPPPTEWSDLHAPSGATQTEYRSGALSLAAWINPPNNSEPRPAILFLHPGFALESDDWAAVKPLRDAGYIVMIPTMRGENGQHGIFTMDYGEVEDVIAAAEFLRSQPYVLRDRVYVAGYSVGGVLALLAAELSPKFRAAAAISGLTDFGSYLRYARGAKENAPFDTSDQTEIELRSPLAYAASFKCPVRMFYGADERYFAISTPLTAQIARQHGVDAEAVVVKGNHSNDLEQSIRLMLDFFHSRN
jgi:dipeptidyl aminopeptidase/acylaminoacyl peptidase